MNNFQTILLDIDARGVANLTLNRPEKHNSLNAEMIEELRDAFRQIEDNKDVRVVVLSGEGESFCAGGDLGWMRQQVEADRDERIHQAMQLANMLGQLDRLSKPTIARVNGQAYGGGIGMMAVCDIVIAVNDARFALTETKLGLVPATIGPFIIRRMGEGAVRRVALNAQPFKGDVAVGLGLVSEAVAVDQLDAAVEKHIDWILQCAPGAISNTKGWMMHLARHPNEDHTSTSAKRLADRWEEVECEEGLSSFLNRTKPSWQE